MLRISYKCSPFCGALAYLVLRQTGPRVALAAELDDALLSLLDLELDETLDSRDQQHPAILLSLYQMKRRKLKKILTVTRLLSTHNLNREIGS